MVEEKDGLVKVSCSLYRCIAIPGIGILSGSIDAESDIRPI